MSAVPSPSSPDLSGQAKLGGGADAFNAQPSSHSSSPANSTSARQRQAEAAQAAALKPSQQQQAIDAQDHINQVLQSALFVKGAAGADSDASSQQPRSQHPLNPNSAPYSSPNLYRSYPNGGGGPNPYSPYSPQPRSAVPSGSSSGVPFAGNGGYDYSQYYPTGSSPDQSYSSVDSPRMGGAFNPYAAVPAEGFDFQGYGSPQSTSRGSIGGGNGLGVGAPPFNPYEQQQGGGGAGRPYWQMGMPGSPAGGFSPQLNGGANGDRKNSYPGMFSPLPHSAYPLDHQGLPSPAFSSNGRFSRQSHGQTASQSQIHQQQQQAGARLRGGGARFPSRTLGFGGNGSMAGNGYGGPGAFHHPTPAIPRSPLLEEFRNNKSRQWGLADIADHVVEFSKDQHGSRFIQQKLEGASDEDRQLVFKEVVTDAFSIQTDVFGNYVIQKLFEFGDASQKTELAQTMSGNVLRLSLQTYGCRAIQKALEHVEAEQRAALVGELKGSILECVKSSNANHVVQRIVSLPEPGLDFVDAFRGQVFELSTHPYGCRVLQRCFEHLPQEQTRPLLDEMHQFTQNLVLDQFGNYVVQYVLEHGTDDDRRQIIAKLRGQMLHLARHKFASNVCEKALITASAEDRRELIQEIMLPSSIIVLLKDAYGNYVLQRILRSIAPDQKPELVEMIKPLLEQMRKVSTSSYSKHLISVERLLADRPESLLPASLPSSLPQTPSTTDHGSSSAPNSSVPTPSNRSDEGALVESLGGLALNGKGDSANGA